MLMKDFPEYKEPNPIAEKIWQLLDKLPNWAWGLVYVCFFIIVLFMFDINIFIDFEGISSII